MNILFIFLSDSLSKFGLKVPDSFNALNSDSYIYIAIAYFISVIIIAKIGSKRAIGGLNAFLLSTFLTPFVGLFIVLISPPKLSHSSGKKMTRMYKCRYCGYKFKDRFDECPICKAKRT